MSSNTFSSRLGMMLAMLGMAVGTGNIWRFPRIAAQNGGGEFLVAWVFFLLLWSIPLMMVEFGTGRKTRSGVFGSFVQIAGPKFGWMGGFVCVTACGIMFYYSVVAGWTFSYAWASIRGVVPEEIPGEYWIKFTGSNWPIFWHAIAIGFATFVVWHGVKAIERVAKVLLPALVLLVVVLTIRALTLDNATDGLAYLFTVDWENLATPKIWIEALTQNAWDTGAGFGLCMTYAAYLRANEDTSLNAIILPTGNNLISLFAGAMVICTVFSVVPSLVASHAQNPELLQSFPQLAEAIASGQPITDDVVQEKIFKADHVALTFKWVPQLLATIWAGQFFTIVFFVALSFAAITSLIATVELGSRVVRDFGVPRQRAVAIVGGCSFLAGLPSAFHMPFLNNQDWVWGVALILCGLFMAIMISMYGVKRFREEQLNHEYSNIKIGAWWDVVIVFLVPVQAIGLIAWWLWIARGGEFKATWTLFSQFNVGTVLIQWAIALVVLVLLNKKLASLFLAYRERSMGDVADE